MKNPVYLKHHPMLIHRGLSTTIQSVKLSIAKYGDQTNLERLVIMHGLFGSKQNWNSLAKSISKQFKRQVLTIDARNHGISPHTKEMTYHHMAADLRTLIEEENIRPAIVLGHSMGGRAAMFLALTSPDLVSKLIVVDISPLGSSPSLAGMSKYFEALRKVYVEKGSAMSAARKIADGQLSSSIPDSMVRQFLLTNLIQKPDDSYGWRLNLDAIENNFHKEIAQFPRISEESSYKGPTLFIAGEQSDYLKPEDEDGIKKLFPLANFQYIAGTGHWLHAEKPNEFLQSLRLIL